MTDLMKLISELNEQETFEWIVGQNTAVVPHNYRVYSRGYKLVYHLLLAAFVGTSAVGAVGDGRAHRNPFITS